MAIDVSVPSRTAAQFWIAIAVLAVSFVLVTIALYRTRFAGLTTQQKRHRSRIIGQLSSYSPVTYSFSSDDPVDEHVEHLRHTIGAAENRDESIGRTSMRHAAGEIRRALGEAWRPVTDHVPAWSIRVSEVALVLALTGAMATMTGYVVALLQRDFVTASPTVWARRITETTSDVLLAGRELLFSFPYLEVVYSLALAYGIQLWSWAYDHWAAIAILLVLGAIGFAIVDRRTPEEFHPTVVHDRLMTGLELSAAVVVVWVVGIIPAALGQVAGFPGIGDIVGFGTASAVLLWYLAVFGRRLYYRLRRIAGAPMPSSTVDVARIAYIIVHRVWSALAILAVPLILAYLVVLVVEGRAVRILRALLAAPPETLAIGAGVLLLGLLALAYLARETWSDVRAALSETLARQQVHAKLLGRGLPYLLVGFGYVVIYSLTQSIAIAALGAVFVGLVAIALYHLGRRARYRVELFDPEPRTPRRILVQAYPPIDDADGVERRLAVINGDVQLLRDDPETLLEDVVTVADGLASEGETPSTIGEWRAEQAVEYGLADAEEVEAKIEERARKLILDELRDETIVPESDVEEASEDIPESMREQVLEWLRRKGFVERRKDHLRLVRDPFES